MNQSERITVGRIVKACGLRGEVTVRSLSDTPRRWRKGAAFHLSFDNNDKGSLTSGAIMSTLIVETVSGKGTFRRIKWREVNDRNGAERLAGGYLEVAQRLPLKGKWSFYNDDLIGLAVIDDRGETVGKVVDVLEMPSTPGLEIRSPDGETAVIPFLRRFIKAVDISAKELRVKLIPGLLPWLKPLEEA